MVVIIIKGKMKSRDIISINKKVNIYFAMYEDRRPALSSGISNIVFHLLALSQEPICFEVCFKAKKNL